MCVGSEIQYNLYVNLYREIWTGSTCNKKHSNNGLEWAIDLERINTYLAPRVRTKIVTLFFLLRKIRNSERSDPTRSDQFHKHIFD